MQQHHHPTEIEFRDVAYDVSLLREQSLLPVINLGDQPLSNAFLDPTNLGELSGTMRDPHYPLVAARCEACTLMQLTYDVPREAQLNDQYAYFSSANKSGHWEELAQLAIGMFHPKRVLEVASNDGYLLRYFKEAGIEVLRVKPSENVARIAVEKHGIPANSTQIFGQNSGIWRAGKPI